MPAKRLSTTPVQTGVLFFALVLASLLIWRSVVQFNLATENPPIATDHESLLQQLKTRLADQPGDAHALMQLAITWKAKGEYDKSDRAVALAAALLPANAAMQLQAAAYWLERGQLQQAISHWEHLVQITQRHDKDVFSLFLQLAELPQSRELIFEFASTDTSWWPRFFAYVARQPGQAGLVEQFYATRLQSGLMPNLHEQRVYIATLLREKRWQAAYLAWLNSLSAEQRRVLGQLFNGSFEQPLTNYGFGWHTPRTEAARVDLHAINPRNKALRIVFRNRETRFHHLYQHLLLSPGNYQFMGQVKKDSVRAVEGLQWQIHCLGGNGKIIAHSQAFQGVDQWQPFSFQFEIPPKDCQAQTIRLVSLGRERRAWAIKGILWFDDLSIRRN